MGSSPFPSSGPQCCVVVINSMLQRNKDGCHQTVVNDSRPFCQHPSVDNSGLVFFAAAGDKLKLLLSSTQTAVIFLQLPSSGFW